MTFNWYYAGSPYDCSSIVRRLNELDGYIKGYKRDDSPEAREEVRILTNEWRRRGEANYIVAIHLRQGRLP